MYGQLNKNKKTCREKQRWKKKMNLSSSSLFLFKKVPAAKQTDVNTAAASQVLHSRSLSLEAAVLALRTGFSTTPACRVPAKQRWEDGLPFFGALPVISCTSQDFKQGLSQLITFKSKMHKIVSTQLITKTNFFNWTLPLYSRLSWINIPAILFTAAQGNMPIPDLFQEVHCEKRWPDSHPF